MDRKTVKETPVSCVKPVFKKVAESTVENCQNTSVESQARETNPSFPEDEARILITQTHN
jgi:hypothetical protein